MIASKCETRGAYSSNSPMVLYTKQLLVLIGRLKKTTVKKVLMVITDIVS